MKKFRAKLKYVGMRCRGVEKFKNNQHMVFTEATLRLSPTFWVNSSIFVSYYCELICVLLVAYNRFINFVDKEVFFFPYLNDLWTALSFFYKIFISLKSGRIGFLNEGLYGYVNLSLWVYSDTIMYNCEPFRYIRHKILTRLRSSFRDMRLQIGSRLLPNWRRMFLFKITMGKAFVPALRSYMLY